MPISAALGSSALLPAGLGFRNKIINGDFSVNQRGSANYTGGGTLGRFMDMWSGYATAGTVTFSPSTVAPEGFATSVLVNVSVAGTYSSGGNYCLFGTKVEGYNMIPFGWGTSWAKPAILSFWARSSVVGTYTVALQNDGYQDTVYVATFSITTQNVWQKIILNIPAVTSGTWNGITNSSRTSGCLWMAWSFGTDTNFETSNVNTWQSLNRYGTASGVDLAANAGATFYLTGVQLEQNIQATPFEQRPYGVELALCQRYYFKTDNASAVAHLNVYHRNSFPVVMRARPTITYNNFAGSFTTGNVGVDGFYAINTASTTAYDFAATGVEL